MYTSDSLRRSLINFHSIGLTNWFTLPRHSDPLDSPCQPRVDAAKFGHNWILHLNTTPQVDKVPKERSYQIKSDPNPVLVILYFICMTLLVDKRSHTVRYSTRGNSVEVRGNSVVIVMALFIQLSEISFMSFHLSLVKFKQ